MRNRVPGLLKQQGRGPDRRLDTKRGMASDRARARRARRRARWFEVQVVLTEDDLPHVSRDWPFRSP
jgi:hypothetical protein